MREEREMQQRPPSTGLLGDWMNDIQGRVDGLGMLILAIGHTMPESQYQAFKKLLAEYLEAFKAHPLVDDSDETLRVRLSHTQTVELALMIWERAREEGDDPATIDADKKPPLRRAMDLLTLFNAGKNFGDLIGG